MTQIRFYLDEHVSRAIEQGLRQLNIDTLRVAEAGLLGEDDELQLAFAAREGRTIYTNDDDFLKLHASGVSHAGIVYARKGISIQEAIRGLSLIHTVYTPAEMENRVEFL